MLSQRPIGDAALRGDSWRTWDHCRIFEHLTMHMSPVSPARNLQLILVQVINKTCRSNIPQRHYTQARESQQAVLGERNGIAPCLNRCENTLESCMPCVIPDMQQSITIAYPAVDDDELGTYLFLNIGFDRSWTFITQDSLPPVVGTVSRIAKRSGYQPCHAWYSSGFIKVWPCWPLRHWETAAILSEYREGRKARFYCISVAVVNRVFAVIWGRFGLWKYFGKHCTGRKRSRRWVR